MTEKELTEAEVMQSAENLKKWCEERYRFSTCDCPHANENACKLRDHYPRF